MLATEGVSSQAADILQKDGWKVHRVGLLANPGTWTQEASQARHRRRLLQFVLLLLVLLPSCRCLSCRAALVLFDVASRLCPLLPLSPQ